MVVSGWYRNPLHLTALLGVSSMVYVKFGLKFQVLKFHCNFTEISTPVFGLHAIRILVPRPVKQKETRGLEEAEGGINGSLGPGHNLQ